MATHPGGTERRMNVGQIALVGDNEFRRECDPMDRALLGRAGGPGTPIVIVPTAATNENPYVAGENGMRHFRRLGAAPEKLMIVDAETAHQTEMAAALEQFRFVYFTGGDPVYLNETLRGSQAWEAVLAVYRRGGLIAGSSAGAMVLGGQLWRFDGWVPGLGLAPGIAVLPHHATLSARWGGAALAAALPAGVALVGIDDATALLLPTGLVLGVGEVTVYGRAGPVAYAPGAELPPLSGLLG
jgi:cyanophycinase